MNNIREQLFLLADESYRDFHSKLIPTVEKEKIIGVRTPILRKFAKDFFKSGEYEDFLNTLPHEYYEESNLHAFLIEQIKDYDTAMEKTKEFLPYVDNWATCDMFMPKIFAKNKEKVLEEAKKMINSTETYTIRYGIGILMKLFSDSNFNEKYLEYVCNVKSEEYYVNMMRAWYFATLLSKHYEKTVAYIKEKRLDAWTHNKAVQKAVESNRIDKKTKEYLKTLKI